MQFNPVIRVQILSAIICACLVIVPASAQPRQNGEPHTYHTIGHEILDLESAVAPVSPALYARLDTIIDDAKRRIPPLKEDASRTEERAYALQVFRIIDSTLIQHNILYPENDESKWTKNLTEGLTPQNVDPEVLDRILGQINNSRRLRYFHRDNNIYFMDCDIASFVYLSIAEALNLPMTMVDLPKHNFVRWILDDGTSVNWETIYGMTLSDGQYIASYLGSESNGNEAAEEGVYMRSLSRVEILGYCHAVRAMVWEKQRRWDRALEDYREAVRRYPLSELSQNNLAWLRATCPDPHYRNGGEAVEAARRAVTLFRNANNLDTYAAACAEAGDFPLAYKLEMKAYELSRKEEYKHLAEAYKKGITYARYQIEKREE